MIAKLHRQMIRSVMRAAERGQPLARWVVERETRRAYASIDVPSPIIKGQFMIPDPDQPLPDEDDEIMGELPRVPLSPTTVAPDMLQGKRVDDMSTMLGSYGMGSYRFFGLLLGAHWFIVPIVNAAEWIALDGRLLEVPGDRAKEGWIQGGDDTALLARLRGARIDAADLRRHGLTLVFDNGAALTLDEDPSTRPPFAENGRPRVLAAGDDLAASLLWSPSGEVFL